MPCGARARRAATVCQRWEWLRAEGGLLVSTSSSDQRWLNPNEFA
jgi:hypothetical protein